MQQEPSCQDESKRYFVEMINTVQAQLNALSPGSLIKKYFPKSRLDKIRQEVEAGNVKELAHWQPLFLFLQNQTESAIAALDNDIAAVVARTGQSEEKVCEFLRDERDRDGDGPWMAGLFEVFSKATLLKSGVLSVDALDWALPNGRNVDARVCIGQHYICVECTTRGESEAGKQRWRDHCEALADNPDRTYFERQDAYTAGRMLYGTVYNKLAPDWTVSKTQLCPDSSNLLLISLHSVVSDLRSDAPSIGWALDELFGSQPNGGTTPISLQTYLLHDERRRSQFSELIAAPTQISGVLLFDNCKLAQARINYNAHDACRISHEVMALFEKVFSQPPPYGP